MANDREGANVRFGGRSSAITLQHLRYAIIAADHGSFRRAADAMLLRQSTLSRCIRQLEESVGMAVFERSSGGVRATPAGRDFLRVARSILEQLDALLATAHSTGRGEAGRLAIGFYTSLSAGNFRASLMDLRLAISTDRSRDDREIAASSRHCASQRRRRYRDRHRRSSVARMQFRVALERANYGCASGRSSARQ